MARDIPVTLEPEGEGITSCLTPPGFNEGRDKGVTNAVSLRCCCPARAGEQVIRVPLRRFPLCPREPSWKAEHGPLRSNSILSLELLPSTEQAATELLWHLPAKEQELLINWLHHLASCSVFCVVNCLIQVSRCATEKYAWVYKPGVPGMKQALWAAAPGFAGACLIDEIDLTEPNIPTFVRQSSQQCQLQGWEHGNIL